MGAAPGEDPGKSLPRWREPHAVPLGSIFVWVVEGCILSGILAAVCLALESLNGKGATNIADTAVYTTLVGGFLLSMLGHLVIANALNRKEQRVAMWAGGLHLAVSCSVCTACFAATVVYTTLLFDACLLPTSSPTATYKGMDMCHLLFRGTPLPQVPPAYWNDIF